MKNIIAVTKKAYLSCDGEKHFVSNTDGEFYAIKRCYCNPLFRNPLRKFSLEQLETIKKCDDAVMKKLVS